MTRRGCLRTCITVLGSLAAAPWPLAPVRAGEGAIRRQLRFTVSLTNPRTHELRDQILWLYGPAADTPTQKLDAIRVSMPYESLSDGFGHSIIKLAFPQIAPLARKVVSITADVRLTSTPAPTPPAEARSWLGAERYIEADDARLRALAAELKRPAERDTARAIYDWIPQHLQYAGYVADDRGAREALNRRRGDCTEYAYLAVALARANGIPARMVGGYVTDRNSVLRAEDYHNWAEVYLDGAWRLLDAQKGRWLAPAEQYVAFRYYRDEAVNPIGLAHRFRMKGALEVRL
jgi:transglutaminase-like putative cysteine protease